MADQEASPIAEQLGLGDHVAFFFKSNEERLSFVIPYMIDGLRNNERCVYVVDENTVPEILAEFNKAGIDIDASTASGALSVVTKHDTYLRHGIFDPAGMVGDLDRDVRFALQHGFFGPAGYRGDVMGSGFAFCSESAVRIRTRTVSRLARATRWTVPIQ